MLILKWHLLMLKTATVKGKTENDAGVLTKALLDIASIRRPSHGRLGRTLRYKISK